MRKTDFFGKKKAVTFSYDDGVIYDERLIEMFDYYGLKGTFNLNSELYGKDDYIEREGIWFHHKRWEREKAVTIYQNHEVAVHTLTHQNLTKAEDAEIIRQVTEDKKNLQQLFGQQVRGMAYPGGGVNCNEHVAEVLRQNTPIAYARTTISSYNFEMPDDLLLWKPSIYHIMEPGMMELGRRFIELETDEPALFSIWGHSYEFHFRDAWDEMESFCKLIAGHDDIFYGTNAEVLL